MGDASRVRWYRGGFERWELVIVFALLGLMFGGGLILQAVTVPTDRTELIPGIASSVIAAVMVTLQLRAGLGAGADHLIVRDAIGRTRKIPWTSITRFEIGRPPGSRGGAAIIVVCADGRRWYTSGCTTGLRIRQADREMIRTLEAERLGRTPEGAAPIPEPLSVADQRSQVIRRALNRRAQTAAFIFALACFLAMAGFLFAIGATTPGSASVIELALGGLDVVVLIVAVAAYVIRRRRRRAVASVPPSPTMTMASGYAQAYPMSKALGAPDLGEPVGAGRRRLPGCSFRAASRRPAGRARAAGRGPFPRPRGGGGRTR